MKGLDWDVRLLEDSLDRYASIAGESLQGFDPDIWRTYAQRIGPENIRCIWQDNMFAGGLAFYRMGQWYGGLSVPCAGVSGVAIDPAWRGSGACRVLLTQTLQELHAERMPMASLYASTQYLYRSVGFEVSGTSMTYKIDMEAFNSKALSRDLPVHRETAPDIARLQLVDDVRGSRHNGVLRRTPGLWERILGNFGATTSTYWLGEAPNSSSGSADAGKLPHPVPPVPAEGYLILLHGKRSDGHPQPLTASDWVTTTPRSLNRMMRLILDHRSMCDTFRWNGGPQDPLLLAANTDRIEVERLLHSLNRIVHLPSCLEARGYPENLRGELHLKVRDLILPENDGQWILRIEDGQAFVRPGGDGHLCMDIRDLVPLFTSFLSCQQLVHAGRIVCADAAQVALADQVFSGPQPWTSELF